MINSFREDSLKRNSTAYLGDLTRVMDTTHQVYVAEMSNAARMLTGRFKELKALHDGGQITTDTYAYCLVPLNQYLKKYPDNTFLVKKDIESEISKFPGIPGLR